MVFYDDDMKEIPPTLRLNQKRVVLITHDECTFYCNEGKKFFWMENRKKKLLPKSKGKSIMLSGFVCPCHGFMSATINGEVINSYLKFYAGTQREGWFTNQDLVKQINVCAPLFQFMHPDCDILLAFDNSMTHRSHAPDALDAMSSNLNLGDGGKNCQPIRNGWYINKDEEKIIQNMQYENGIQKGIKQILLERDLFKDNQGRYGLFLQCRDCREKVPRNQRQNNNEKCCARYVLSQQPDFMEQESWLIETAKKHNFSVIFYPKYHCELNFIEILWGYIKSYHRRNCTYNYKDLDTDLSTTLTEKIPLLFVQKAYRHCFRFISGYRQGMTGGLLDYAVKKYKSHRCIPVNMLMELTEQYNASSKK